MNQSLTTVRAPVSFRTPEFINCRTAFGGVDGAIKVNRLPPLSPVAEGGKTVTEVEGERAAIWPWIMVRAERREAAISISAISAEIKAGAPLADVLRPLVHFCHDGGVGNDTGKIELSLPLQFDSAFGKPQNVLQRLLPRNQAISGGLRELRDSRGRSAAYRLTVGDDLTGTVEFYANAPRPFAQSMRAFLWWLLEIDRIAPTEGSENQALAELTAAVGSLAHDVQWLWRKHGVDVILPVRPENTLGAAPADWRPGEIIDAGTGLDALLPQLKQFKLSLVNAEDRGQLLLRGCFLPK